MSTAVENLTEFLSEHDRLQAYLSPDGPESEFSVGNATVTVVDLQSVLNLLHERESALRSLASALAFHDTVEDTAPEVRTASGWADVEDYIPEDLR